MRHLATMSAHVAMILAVASSLAVADETDLEARRAMQQLFHQATERATQWVVQIETIGGSQPRDVIAVDQPAKTDDGTPPRENLFQDRLGSDFLVADGPTTGIVYESDGWILASSFNFVRDPTHVTVRLADGRRFVANLVGRDRVRKLVILKIDAVGLVTPEWVPTSEIRVGQTALALGRGFGGDTPSVTVGVVSALNRMMGNAIQTDAKLSPANYGGPVIDLEGRCLGIAVPMAQQQGELAGVEFYDAGVGFAVPQHRVREIADALKKGKSFYRGWLGVQTDPRFKNGLLIARIANPSPMWDLGIRSGAIIVYANGQEIRHIGNLRKAIYMVPAGEMVRIVVRDRGLDYGYEVVLARSTELGPLATEEPRIDPTNPFPIPRGKVYPWKKR